MDFTSNDYILYIIFNLIKKLYIFYLYVLFYDILFEKVLTNILKRKII